MLYTVDRIKYLNYFFLFCQQLNVLSAVVVLMCLHHVLCEPPNQQYHQRPLLFKSWPPSRTSAALRGNGMMFHHRGSGSSNVASRVPAPGMFIKSAAPIRFAIPMRQNGQKGSLQSSPSNHVFFKSGFPQAAAYKRPNLNNPPGVFKFSAPSQKTAIKFQVCSFIFKTFHTI